MTHSFRFNIKLKSVACILTTVAMMLSALSAKAQYNEFELGDKKLYFGIHMGTNFGDFKVKPSPLSTRSDSVYTVHAKKGPGFNLGIIGNYQFHKHFDLRFIPSLIFSDKTLTYNTSFNSSVKKTISSIYLDFPVMLRVKSQPVRDMKVFVLAGLRYDYDLAANSGARKADNLVKLYRNDLCVEYGIGLSFYSQYFIFSPELKVSHGLLNIHSRDESLIYSRVIDKLFSRAFTISINFEG